MSLILPIVAWLILFQIFQSKDNCWRQAILSTTIVWGVLVTLITEILSLLRLIEYLPLICLWLLINTVLFLVLFSCEKNNDFKKRFNFKFSEQRFYIFSLFCVAFITFTVGLIAVIVPPNNWDSMSYHMPRVVNWIQNHSVAHYPTNYTPQLYQPPWTEFAIMHFQILSGSDRFANLVQWFSMIGCLIGVSLLAKRLGGSFQGQVLAVVVASTIPMGILQASNTKNDYVLSFWLVCFVYYIILSLSRKNNKIYILRISFSLALAILTKGTAYIYSFPFLLWFTIFGIRRFKWSVFKYILTIGGIVIVLNAGHYMRNFYLFGSPISTFTQKYTNDVFSIPTFISSVIKNAALHMVIPLDIGFNNMIEGVVYKLHNILNVDINDPRITWLGTKFSMQGVPTFEDTAGNPVHFWLILFTISLYITNYNLRKQKYSLSYLIAVLSSFLLFCFLVKWQPWHSRLHLPIFILFSPFVGVFLVKAFRYSSVAKYIIIILIQTSLIFVLCNENKPVLAHKNIINTTRMEQYFQIRDDIKNDYINAANVVKQQKCRNIGLSLYPDAWEYPFWVLLKKNDIDNARIEHVNVTNISSTRDKIYPFSNFIPCAIISVGSVPSQVITTKEGIYVKAWQSIKSLASVQVFVRSQGHM